MQPEGVYQSAIEWIELGVGLVPLQPRSKHIVAGFGPRQRIITAPGEAHTWFRERRCNLGLVLGAGVLKLICLDFDDAGAYQAWCAAVGGQVATRIESTARGYHVYFSSCERWRAAAGAGVELKTSGVVMTAPSVHPSGAAYLTLCAGPIAQFDFAIVRPAFPSLSKPKALPSKPRLKRADAVHTAGLSVAWLKERYPVLPVAQGLTQLRQAARDGNYWHGCCPFHDDRRASFWVNTVRNLWGCMASTCPQRGTHDVLNLVAAARGITLSDAIRQLAEEAR